MKVVINECWGGFGLSKEAQKRLLELGDSEDHIKKMPDAEYFRETNPEKIKEEKERFKSILDDRLDGPDYVVVDEHHWKDELRSCPLLVQVVEELGEKANGRFAKLVVVEIPDGTDYEIDEYDGQESVEEKHQSWR